MTNSRKRYQFTPKGPILIEMFPKHDHFAVRTAGLPGMIGALGACFGKVVTLDSPRARPGEFQWEGTLWHELAHVITLQLSNQRLPRWLSEGISEYEETVERPGRWGRAGDLMFANLMNRGEAIKLKELDPRISIIALSRRTPKWSRECQRQEHKRQTSQQQQQPMLDAAATRNSRRRRR